MGEENWEEGTETFPVGFGEEKLPPSPPSVANTTADNPKSAIFKMAESEGSDSSRFSGFKSLCTTPKKMRVEKYK
jgi:hypothetical protein